MITMTVYLDTFISSISLLTVVFGGADNVRNIGSSISLDRLEWRVPRQETVCRGILDGPNVGRRAVLPHFT